MQAKEFHLGDVLSITTGCLVSPRHLEGVYDILNFMSGDNLFTHQLPRVCREAAPVLLRQHPVLADIAVPKKFEGTPHVERWLTEQVAICGKTLPVVPMTKDEHEYREPLSELGEAVQPDRTIPVRT